MPSNDTNRPAGGPAPAALPSTFINPYQFVPLGDGPVRNRTRREYTGNLSGKIHCSLTIKTPLAISDASREEKDEKEHKTYPFLRFYHDDKEPPMIPGSELRGMVRSVYEAATNSCMGVLDDLTLYARSTQLTRTAGLVKMDEDGKWYLYPAKATKIRKESADQADNGSDEKGVLLIGEQSPGGSRQNRYIFQLVDGAEKKRKPLPDGIDQLKKVLELYRNPSINKALTKPAKGQPKHTGYAGYEISETDYNPVFYREVSRNGKKEYILSLAMQGREVFSRKLADFAGGYAPCTCREGENICPACAMFGQINQNTSGGFCGRVRFTDAMGDETN